LFVVDLILQIVFLGHTCSPSVRRQK